ncbi:hypothetical protein GCM10009801_31800 [Streptomyces albiaxialis]|uniref:Uncharacterized protein n=1 Tax=Streptomyces albiaxialis TaxID=329523 RepID=A0ABN2VYA7_9ACTN
MREGRAPALTVVLVLAVGAMAPVARADEGAAGTAPVRATKLTGPDGTMTTVLDVNKRGHVVGTGEAPDGTPRGFLWDGERLRTLPPLPGGHEVRPAAINARGLVAGSDSTAGGTRRVVLWKDGEPRRLAADEPDAYAAVDVNDRGQVLGHHGSGSDARAFLWRDGRSARLPAPDGAVETTPAALDERGDVTAMSYVPGPEGSVRYRVRKGRVVPLPDLPGTLTSWLHQGRHTLNERGDAVGHSVLPGTTGIRALLWSGGRPVAVGGLGGQSAAVAVNGRGDVTGWSGLDDDPRKKHAFRWRAGTMTDLGVPDGHVVSEGVLLTPRGDVVGHALRPDGVTDAYVWSVG